MLIFASSKKYLQRLHTNWAFVSDLLIKLQNSATCLLGFERHIADVWVSNRGIQSASQSILTRPETSPNQRQFRLMPAFISVHKTNITSCLLFLALTSVFLTTHVKRGSIRGEQVWEREAACWREIKMFMILRKEPWHLRACRDLEPGV